MFQTLNRELGLTILIVSHDPTIARHVQRVMAIRDGKAASETVRRHRQQMASLAHISHEEHEEHFEELVVLDSAGRLQVPKAYREALQINSRVRMEMVENGIMIRPVPLEEHHQLPPELLQAAEAAEETKHGRMQSLRNRWRKKQ
jgi:bifunctional DNA-binding transcriptional regulator/antitoxin component of YhaV-PrlF toxin-antitoxin module